METEIRVLILHGVLHLAGMDHETDGGRMSLDQGYEMLIKITPPVPCGVSSGEQFQIQSSV